ncbi:MAG: hypothetical protein GPOALKHO_000866 [Sodalis sp.]|nr:MAG: hypothetical protein GPOALKHO_000866 [Sodalis sp.]
MRKICHEVLKELELSDDLLEVAMELEHIALHDPYFKERKLYPNVDFLLWHHFEGHGNPLNHVHSYFRRGAYSWLDSPLERDVR